LVGKELLIYGRFQKFACGKIYFKEGLGTTAGVLEKKRTSHWANAEKYGTTVLTQEISCRYHHNGKKSTPRTSKDGCERRTAAAPGTALDGPGMWGDGLIPDACMAKSLKGGQPGQGGPGGLEAYPGN